MADMADMLKNFSSMMEGKEIPDNIKEMLNSLTNNNSNEQNSNNSGNSNTSNNFENTNSNNTNSQNSNRNSFGDMPNIDINTMMKMQKIMSAMNSNSNNSGANLLRSLKPYLKPSRQAKVDEYIQLFNIEKVISLMNNSGGDKKNDT